MINKLTPADQLKTLLLAGHGPDTEDVQSFFKLHKVGYSLVGFRKLPTVSLPISIRYQCDIFRKYRNF